MESTHRFVVCIAVVLFGCSSEDPGTIAEAEVASANEGPPDGVYQLERRTEIRIDLASSDWDSLRYEGRSVSDLEQTDYEYNGYLGTVTVDGVVYADVEVKKKGFIGSVSAIRPSLRLDFKRGGVELDTGLRRLTLNGDVQDRTHVRQCMAFDLFARAGIPSPRCALARVIVNGKDLGTYTNVEPIREPMLRRHFSDADGNLYEGTLADFDDESWEQIEVKTNEMTNDRSDLRRLVTALKESDEALVSALTPLIDLDQFRSFWAVETLLGHWDGYAESANNYYLYHDPGTDKFAFIPWGVDQAFTGEKPFGGRPYDPSVYAGAKLTQRLYALPEQRELFRQRLGELNDTLWDVAALVKQSRVIAALAPDADQKVLAAHQAFLDSHPARVRDALAKPPAPLEALEGPPSPPPTCVGNRPLAASFDSRWGNGAGSVSAELEADGQPRTMSLIATMNFSADSPGQAALNMFTPLDSGSGLVLAILMPLQLVRPGTHRLHALETFGLVGRTGPDGAFAFLGFVGDGQIQFDRAGTTEGAAISGRVEGVLYQTACLDPSHAEVE